MIRAKPGTGCRSDLEQLERMPQGLKPRARFSAHAARVNSCPDTKPWSDEFSAAGAIVP